MYGMACDATRAIEMVTPLADAAGTISDLLPSPAKPILKTFYNVLTKGFIPFFRTTYQFHNDKDYYVKEKCTNLGKGSLHYHERWTNLAKLDVAQLLAVLLSCGLEIASIWSISDAAAPLNNGASSTPDVSQVLHATSVLVNAASIGLLAYKQSCRPNTKEKDNVDNKTDSTRTYLLS